MEYPGQLHTQEISWVGGLFHYAVDGHYYCGGYHREFTTFSGQ